VGGLRVDQACVLAGGLRPAPAVVTSRTSRRGTGGCYRSSARVPALRRSEVRIPSGPPGSRREPPWVSRRHNPSTVWCVSAALAFGPGHRGYRYTMRWPHFERRYTIGAAALVWRFTGRPEREPIKYSDSYAIGREPTSLASFFSQAAPSSERSSCLRSVIIQRLNARRRSRRRSSGWRFCASAPILKPALSTERLGRSPGHRPPHVIRGRPSVCQAAIRVALISLRRCVMSVKTSLAR
jgi:hypothetical protein